MWESLLSKSYQSYKCIQCEKTFPKVARKGGEIMSPSRMTSQRPEPNIGDGKGDVKSVRKLSHTTGQGLSSGKSPPVLVWEGWQPEIEQYVTLFILQCGATAALEDGAGQRVDGLPEQSSWEVQVAEEEGGDLGIVRWDQEVQGLRHHRQGGDLEMANNDIESAAEWSRWEKICVTHKGIQTKIRVSRRF